MFKGERVTLRATRREDMQRQWASENDPELWFLDGGVPRPTRMEALLAHFDKGTSSGDDVSFAIEADDQYIGHCGLHSFDSAARCCELSIEIGDKAYWGRGYGREVVRLLLDYAFKHRNMNRVWLTTHSENERAIRCYRPCLRLCRRRPPAPAPLDLWSLRGSCGDGYPPVGGQRVIE
jgi:RimJ/RimL family protein N-acetyltransferase